MKTDPINKNNPNLRNYKKIDIIHQNKVKKNNSKTKEIVNKIINVNNLKNSFIIKSQKLLQKSKEKENSINKDELKNKVNGIDYNFLIPNNRRNKTCYSIIKTPLEKKENNQLIEKSYSKYPSSIIINNKNSDINSIFKNKKKNNQNMRMKKSSNKRNERDINTKKIQNKSVELKNRNNNIIKVTYSDDIVRKCVKRSLSKY